MSEKGEAIAQFRGQLAEGEISIKSFSEQVSQLGVGFSAASDLAKGFTNAVTATQNAFKAAADLAAGNIDELVGLYNAQINVISSQNKYTQALALQATAATIYGRTSEQATRATTAASYVGALYTQSKKNEVVAQMEYTTASAKNLATISQSFVTLMQSADMLIIGMQLLAVSAEQSATRAALAAIPLVGMVASLGIMAYQMATTPALPSPSIKGYQSGGYVSRTGLAMVHQGETVVPKSGGVGAGMGNVQITINASSNVDLARVRQEVENALAKTLLQASKQRGVY